MGISDLAAKGVKTLKKHYKYRIIGILARESRPGRPFYKLETTKNKMTVEKLVGLGRLRSMYCDGHIVGVIPDSIRVKLGLPRRKGRSDKGKKKRIT